MSTRLDKDWSIRRTPVMNQTHKIALAPTWAQHAGYARVAYNHALADFKVGLDEGEWRNERTLCPHFNAVKFKAHPWARSLSQNAAKYAIIALGDAVKAWRNDRQANRFPTFKSRRKHRRAFRADNGPDTVRAEGKRILLPKIGWVKMRERLRFVGSVRETTIVQDGGRWFACVAVRTQDEHSPFDPSKPALGVDVAYPRWRSYPMVRATRTRSRWRALKASWRGCRRPYRGLRTRMARTSGADAATASAKLFAGCTLESGTNLSMRITRPQPRSRSPVA